MANVEEQLKKVSTDFGEGLAQYLREGIERGDLKPNSAVYSIAKNIMDDLIASEHLSQGYSDLDIER